MSAAVAGSEEIVSLDYDTIELLDHANGDEAIVPKSGRVGSLSREERGSWYFIGHGVVDSVLVMGPLMFLSKTSGGYCEVVSSLIAVSVVAIICLKLNNQKVTLSGDKIKAITLLAPTIFPIVYAAILGKFLRRLGHFVAERGTTLGVLIPHPIIFFALTGSDVRATHRMSVLVLHVRATVWT